jgi:poly(A) polymerase
MPLFIYFVTSEIVLGKFDRLLKEFVKRVGMQQGMPESVAMETGGKIFTFGSYRLGVHSKGKIIMHEMKMQMHD